MKILIVLPYLSVYGKNTNPIVMSMANGLSALGHDVICSDDDLWQNYQQYDVIFFQWPEALCGYVNHFGIDALESHLEEIRRSKVKTVVTCHNLHPHNCDALTTKIYDLLYSKVDAMHHMGDFSYNYMKQNYPDKYHFTAPHHITESFFDQSVSKEKARELLQIPIGAVVISSFGAFRNSEEEHLFVQMAKDLGRKDFCFLAPRMSKGQLYNGRMINRSLVYLYKTLLYKRLNLKCVDKFLTEQEQEVWLAASDIIFIQRKEILNSGNVPLAFAKGKIVVGPDKGNVGSILKETGNFWFNPNDRMSVKKSVIDAVVEYKTGNRAIQNLQYAKNKWTVDVVCKIISDNLIAFVNGEIAQTV